MKFKYLVFISSFLLANIAILNLQAQPTEIQFLSGTDKDHTVDWGFFIDSGMNSGKWTTIPVPSNWELQGFGTYNYGVRIPERSKETAQYKYRFDVPADWKKKVVNIVFEGVMTDTEVKINGKLAGPVHQGSFYRFKFDISDLINFGKENLLEVKVKNHSDNESVNSAERHADYWIFGGIFRPVYLEALPKAHIEWMAIDARADGSFSLNVYTKNVNSSTRVKAQIKKLDGTVAGDGFFSSVDKQSGMAKLRYKVKDPLLWSPEFPHLYEVDIILKTGNVNLHRIAGKFGFRTVELKPHDGFYVNGQKIRFKGVNRHSFWPESGRCLSKELSIKDVNLMKDMNMNAVRMSHYPPDEHFLDVCDSLGLFVLDELAGWQTYYDAEIGHKLVKEMVTRDVNHPSIVIWDNGNEGGNNVEVDDDFHLYDPQKRPVIHPWEIFRNTDTKHYKDWNCCAGSLFHGSEVFFPTELLHGLYDGGHGAGLEDYWNLMLSNPLSAGAFLWVFSDEGVVRSDKNGEIDTWKNNAPDGIVGPYREKEGSFYTIKEIWSPVHVEDKYITPDFDGTLKVENRYHYTNLNQCTFQWQWVQFPDPEGSSTNDMVMEEGSTEMPSVLPGETTIWEIPKAENWRENDALNLRITDPHERELYTYTLAVKYPKEVSSKFREAGNGKINVGERKKTIELSASGVKVVIDRGNGQIVSVQNSEGQIPLSGGPAVDSLLGNSKVIDIHQNEGDGQYIVSFDYSGEGLKKGLRQHTVTYTMLSSGILKLEYSYLPKQGKYDYLGVNFNYPEKAIKKVKWLGKGPYRVWNNRMRGGKLGVWEKKYNNSITGEYLWQYPEFKGYHANLYWAVIEGEDHRFTVYTETDDLFLRLFTPTPPEGAFNENTDGIFPEGNISFMHAISPIGTKFKKADQLGPQGQKHMVAYSRNYKPFKGVLYFDFR